MEISASTIQTERFDALRHALFEGERSGEPEQFNFDEFVHSKTT